jgi:hypothetical protein
LQALTKTIVAADFSINSATTKVLKKYRRPQNNGLGTTTASEGWPIRLVMK